MTRGGPWHTTPFDNVLTTSRRPGGWCGSTRRSTPRLEVAEIQRRVFRAGGPAVLFTNVRGCRFPMVGNLFGTMERVRYLVPRHARRAGPAGRAAGRSGRSVAAAAAVSGRAVARSGTPGRERFARGRCWPTRRRSTNCRNCVSWPDDGGAFITLPQVYTEDPDRPGFDRSNLGMYRVQLSGGQYRPNEEVGLHYQIHRGIGVHHAAAIRRGEPLRVNVFVGGPPAMTVAAVMPLPEGLSELAFAGVLGRRRSADDRRPRPLPIHAEADFCITGELDPDRQLPEGPFGDHLGYYSLAHDFPVLRVEHVYHRDDAIWPFTVVGRPPQEDTIFGELIHEIDRPGDSDGRSRACTPSMRSTPRACIRCCWRSAASATCPMTDAPAAGTAHPGQRDPRAGAAVAGQVSVDRRRRGRPDAGRPRRRRVPLARARPGRLAARPALSDANHDRHARLLGRRAQRRVEAGHRRGRPGHPRVADGDRRSRWRCPRRWASSEPRVGGRAILVVRGPAYASQPDGGRAICRLVQPVRTRSIGSRWSIVVDDSDFAARTLNNFLWITFTRSNPASDIYGIDAFTSQKHWGCRGSLVIDARSEAAPRPAAGRRSGNHPPRRRPGRSAADRCMG